MTFQYCDTIFSESFRPTLLHTLNNDDCDDGLNFVKGIL
jgi:hypothetical protein